MTPDDEQKGATANKVTQLGQKESFHHPLQGRGGWGGRRAEGERGKGTGAENREAAQPICGAVPSHYFQSCPAIERGGGPC